MGSSLLPGLVLAMFSLSYVFWKDRSRVARVEGTKKVAIAIMGGFALLGGLFAAGYAFTDLALPAAIASVLAYLIPTVALSWVAIKEFRFARGLFIALWVVVLLLGTIRGLLGESAGELLDRFGPVDAIALLMFAFPLSLWARNNARLGGWLLIAMWVVPNILVSMQTKAIVSGTSLDAATGTIAVVGGLFIYAAGQAERIELNK